MKEWTRKEWEATSKSKKLTAYYLYTPMCGTCEIASKMLAVIEEMSLDIEMGKANLNFVESVATDYQIESVPCLIITEHGKVREKIYAFHSVPFLYEKLKKNN
ncbi:MAG: thioredoxin family protein [Paenisporosarcina sp.]